MKKYALTYTLFLMLLFCTPCKGQNKTELQTGSIKSETNAVITSHGPNSTTRTIKQDRNGNIWIAAFDGVFRYDGESFTNITSGVSSARFFSVLEDRKGNLWFGSIGSGVYYYNGKSFQNFTTNDGLINNIIFCIYEDTKGNIWFGAGGGASRYDGKSFRNYMINGDSLIEDRTRKSEPNSTRSANGVNSIIEDKTGKFWFGTDGNALIYDGRTFTTLTHNKKPFRNVRNIIEDKKGNIWLGGTDGLWRYDGSTFNNFTQNFAGYVYEDKNGNIWISSEENLGNQDWVLTRFDVKSLSQGKPSITEIKPEVGMLFGILEDNKGDIWFGARGVYRYDGNTITDFKK